MVLPLDTCLNDQSLSILEKSSDRKVCWDYGHTVQDRLLFPFKSFSGTLWTKIVSLRCRNCSVSFPVWTQALSVIQFATLRFDLKSSLTNTRFHCIFCSYKSVQTWFGPFQKPLRYVTFHFQQRRGAVLFRSRNCFESSIPGVNRIPIRYTFCDTPFHYLVQCEHHLNWIKVIGIQPMAPVLNTGPLEGIWARNVKFFGKERNY